MLNRKIRPKKEMSDKLLHVCFVAPLPPQSNGKSHACGGIGHWTQMVSSYAKSRSDVRISIVDTTPRWRSINTLSSWKRVLSGSWQFSVYIARFFWVLMSQRVDVIHMTTSGQFGVLRDLSIMCIAGMLRIPVIYHIRFGRIPGIAELKNREWRIIARAMLAAWAVIAIDKATRDAIEKHLPLAKVTLIPNCFNFSGLVPEKTAPARVRTVFFAGWVIPSKGVTELVEAWSQIEPHGWRLQIAGPVDAVYRKMLTERFQPKEIEFLGELTHERTIELMAACDLFVLPSYTEGFPNAVLEAMALARPIVATDVGAIPEMLDGECGLLVKPKNVEDLKKALHLFIEDGALRTEAGQRAQKKAMESYSIEVVFARYMDLWQAASARP